MPWPPTIGSRALPAQLTRAGLDLRRDLQRHALELTTARAADPLRRLRGDLGALAAIDLRLDRIEARGQALEAARHLTGIAQQALGRLADLGDSLQGELALVASGEASEPALARTGRSGRTTLQAMISALSVQTSGRAVFSGAATDRGPLPDAGTLMAAVGTHLAGAGTAAEILAGLDDFFDNPAGPFATTIYAGAEHVGVANEPAVGPLPTARHDGIRAALRQAVLAALLDEPAIAPGLTLRRELAAEAAARHPAAAERLIALRAGLGADEASLSASRQQLAAERDALIRGRDGLVGVDPYEAASRLEETRTRLETLYAVTARVARLSLTEYLR